MPARLRASLRSSESLAVCNGFVGAEARKECGGAEKGKAFLTLYSFFIAHCLWQSLPIAAGPRRYPISALRIPHTAKRSHPYIPYVSSQMKGVTNTIES